MQYPSSRGAVILPGLLCLAISLSASLGPDVRLERTQMEEFLLRARIVKTRPAGKGITNSLRATLDDGRITHDAHVQRVDSWQAEFKGAAGVEVDFRDSYRFNIAAYRLDRLLDLGMVPVSVEREFENSPAAFTWWVDEVIMDEAQRRKKKMSLDHDSQYGHQIYRMRTFDHLIDNIDRNSGNMLWTPGWKLWLIDHSRAFGVRKGLRAPKTLDRFDARLLAKLRVIKDQALVEALSPYVQKGRIAALLARRASILKLAQDLIARKGEAAVLFVPGLK
jgi:hypothetical protein